MDSMLTGLLQAKNFLSLDLLLTTAAGLGMLTVLTHLVLKYQEYRLLQHYRRPEQLLSAQELAFYQLLRPMLPPGYQILCKVAVRDAIQRQRIPASERAMFRKLQFDFVLCDPLTHRLRCVIELESAPAAGTHAAQHYAVKRKLCCAIGLPILFFSHDRLSDPVRTTQQLSQELLRPELDTGEEIQLA
ncbi:MAG: DUF2726 domain-containing protein [Marinobacterium sp.]|nr:DUF2726 domain-containing protein [Marinobacterium sp.]